MSTIDSAELEKVAEACRHGLLSLACVKGSTFNGFPSGACGVAADIVGRVVWETLQCEGEYVCGCHHPQLESEVSHAWFEVGEFIIDITYDQFQGTGLSGWIFKRGAGWHAQFPSQKRRDGFCSPSQWPAYPYDGYKAALEEAKKAGLSKKADSGKSAVAENIVERAAAVTDLADHLENDLLHCPTGRAALLSWLETQLAHLACKPVPTAADATWLIESAYIQWAANEPKS